MTKLQSGLVVALVVVAGLAIAGWVREPTKAVSSGVNPEPIAAEVAPAAAPAYDSYGQPVGETAVTYDQPDAALPPYAAPRYVRTVRAQPAAPPAYEEADREYAPRDVQRDYRHHRHHHRSTARSVEIVAGSAGVGAAIGAIAGGGKGAGIGALAGGAGGFVYDRLTHDR